MIMNTQGSKESYFRLYRILIVVAAFIIGIILAAGALLTTGAGDGSFVFFYLFSAPFSLLLKCCNLSDVYGWNVLFSIPILWGIAAILGVISDNAKRRYFLGLFLSAHYISAVIILLQNDPYDNFRRLQYICNFPVGMLMVLIPFIIYLLGQIWLWRQFLSSFSYKDK